MNPNNRAYLYSITEAGHSYQSSIDVEKYTGSYHIVSIVDRQILEAGEARYQLLYPLVIPTGSDRHSILRITQWAPIRVQK